MNALYLTVANLHFHRARTPVLMVTAALVVAMPVPVQTRVLLTRGAVALSARAEATPPLPGTRGGRLDPVMAEAYFIDPRPSRRRWPPPRRSGIRGRASRCRRTRSSRHRTRASSGTALDRFDLRGLETDQGRPFAVPGDAAARPGPGPGDTLLSDPENLFDLDGAYPLETRIAGVPAPTGTPDDDAVLVDIGTAWVIEGIGHGHEDIMVEGEDERAGTMLRGRHLHTEEPVQAAMPSDMIATRLISLGSWEVSCPAPSSPPLPSPPPSPRPRRWRSGATTRPSSRAR